MASFDTTRPLAASRAGVIPTFFASVIGAAIDWNDARVTRKALSKLTVRELDDIGLTPGSLDRLGDIIR